MQAALDERDLGRVPRRVDQLAEHAGHVGALLQPGDRDVSEVPVADLLVAEMAGDVDDLGGKRVGSGGGHEQGALVADVDRGAERHGGRGELGAIECRGDLVRVGVAEEPKGDVPVLGNDESSTDLVFAVEFLEPRDDIVGWPQRNEQTTHTDILAGSGPMPAPLASRCEPRRDDGRAVAVGARRGHGVWNGAPTRQHWGTMSLTIGSRPDPAAALARLDAVLSAIPARVVACSGGVDSLLLATVAHRAAPAATLVAHTVTPAVPDEGTTRVVDYAEREGWKLEVVRSREFDDERYLSNPTDRCYYCKSNLYDAIAELSDAGGVMLSGANVDDLGEYRPGLTAAAERAVRHPYIEAEVTKADIRAMARHLDLDAAELPASPCLASRLYTGTRVTAPRLRAIEAGEQLIRSTTGISVVRCRLRADVVLVEVGDTDRERIDTDLLAAVKREMVAIEPTIVSVELDDRAYEPGRAFVGAPVV